jgi:hypothetical protein
MIQLFVPTGNTEVVLGDLLEEFAQRLSQSRPGQARRWLWRQALRTAAHLAWESVRVAPWSAAALVLGSLVAAAVADRAISGLASLLLASVNAYDYLTAVWYWRAVDASRFVVVPLALGWSVAAIARERGIVIIALTTGLLIAVFAWNMGVLAPHFAQPDPLLGSPGGRRLLYEMVQKGTTFPLSLAAGGMMRRIQQLLAVRIVR